MREFLEAFRAEGLKVGLYHSLPDWTHPGYADTESPECLREGGVKKPHVPTPAEYAAFTNLVYNHVNQLTTEYGKIDLLFLDYTSKTKANLDYFGRDRPPLKRSCPPITFPTAGVPPGRPRRRTAKGVS